MGIREQAFAAEPISVPVIDAHTHIWPDSYMGYYQAIRTNRQIISLLDHLGIDCIVTAPHTLIHGDIVLTNAAAADAVAEHPGRIYAYISICPQRGIQTTRAAINKYSKNAAFVGFKLLPGYHGPLSGEEYDYTLDFASEVGCPVLTHVWGGDPSFSDVEAAVKKRPNLKLILAHQGGGSANCTDIAVALMQDYPNLYMDICGSLMNPYTMEDYVRLAGEDRVIFGTDGNNLDPRFDFGQVVFSTLSDEIMEKILARNFLRLLEGSQMGKIELK